MGITIGVPKGDTRSIDNGSNYDDVSLSLWKHILNPKKENGNYYSIRGFILGLYRGNGKENGNYYVGSRVYGLQPCTPHAQHMASMGSATLNPKP